MHLSILRKRILIFLVLLIYYSLLNAGQEDVLMNSGVHLITKGSVLYLLFISLGTIAAFGIYSFHLKRRARLELAQKNQIISNALAEKEFLLKEIHHRVKNNLQVISSLLSLQSKFIENEAALEAIKEGRDRVKSMALIHQNLYQENNLTGIEIKDYIEKLCRNLFNSYHIDPNKVTLELEIHSLNLDVDTVIPLGLIINELVTNALKYAFPDDRNGIIQIFLKEQNEILNLRVKDNGVGIETEMSRQENQTFGYRLINVFKNKLEAELTVDSKGGTDVFMSIKEYQKVN